jgi:hypothetical protein
MTPPLPRLFGLANLGAAIHTEADYRQTLALEGPRWTRERHYAWLCVCWAMLHPRTAINQPKEE